MARQILLTGGIERGKTTLCRHLVEIAREKGWQVGGILSPAEMEGKRKVGIDLLDVNSGERRPLAHRDQATDGPSTPRWHFLAEALQWGDEILRAALPCDLLVVDELGPLELVREEGWQSGLAAVNSRAYQLAVVVVRPSLLALARDHWPEAQVLEIADPTQAGALATRIFEEEDGGEKTDE